MGDSLEEGVDEFGFGSPLEEVGDGHGEGEVVGIDESEF